MSTTAKKTGDDIMREKLKELSNPDAKKKPKGDGIWLQLQNGSNYLLVLRRKDQTVFYITKQKHFRVGPNSQPHWCIGDQCPTDQAFLQQQDAINRKYPRNAPPAEREKGKEAWKKIARWGKPSDRHLMFVAKMDDVKKHLKDLSKCPVKILEASETLLKDLLKLYYHEEGGNFTDEETGYVVNVELTEGETKGKGKDQYKRNDYGASKSSKYKETRGAIDWDKLYEARDRLGKLTSHVKLPTADEIQAILDGTESTEEPEADEDEQAESEGGGEGQQADAEEDEQPKPKKGLPVCHGNPDDRDVNDETCRQCQYFKTSCLREVKAKKAALAEGKPAGKGGIADKKRRLQQAAD